MLYNIYDIIFIFVKFVNVVYVNIVEKLKFLFIINYNG